MEVESPERGKIGGIAIEIPASDDGATIWSLPRVPPRLLQKLSEPKTSSPTAEEIEAKLRGADLRRQVFNFFPISCIQSIIIFSFFLFF